MKEEGVHVTFAITNKILLTFVPLLLELMKKVWGRTCLFVLTNEKVDDIYPIKIQVTKYWETFLLQLMKVWGCYVDTINGISELERQLCSKFGTCHFFFN